MSSKKAVKKTIKIVEEQEKESPVKPSEWKKIQTAEGWKRSMKKSMGKK